MKPHQWTTCLTLLATAAVAAAADRWQLAERTDRMTDAKVCTLGYTGNPRIWFESNQLVISFHGLGGVDSFRYRIDKHPASELRLGEQWGRGSISIQDWNDELSEGSTLIVDAMTFVPKRPVNMTIDLRGLKAAKAKMRSRCQLE
jgi:hypothetical protein